MLLLLQLLQLRDNLRPHLLRDSSTHRLTDQVQLDLQLEDVGAPVTPVEDGLKLLGGPQPKLPGPVWCSTSLPGRSSADCT